MIMSMGMAVMLTISMVVSGVMRMRHAVPIQGGT